MSQNTTYKRSLSGSIGAGMKSVMGGDGRRFYILEHKVSSKYHKAGESQRIIVDQIEIGRDPKCQVRFDEQFMTVSRRHAAIVRDGDNWKLVQLSKTNSTYLNGHKVENEWYLQNGDEIQLSTNGPKLGFIAPVGDKGLVKSIGMTKRLSLFRQQALKPYKAAVSALACLLVILAAVGGYFLFRANDDLKKTNMQLADAKTLIATNEKMHKEREDSIQSALDVAKSDTKTLQSELSSLKSRFGRAGSGGGAARNYNVGGKKSGNSAINAALPNVFFIYPVKVEVTMPDGEQGTIPIGRDGIPMWSGTGFMLDNGTFVTARHVVEPWYFWVQGSSVDEIMLELNKLVNVGGKVVTHYSGISQSGRRINLTSSQFTTSRRGDHKTQTEEGDVVSFSTGGSNDFAYAHVGGSGLKFDRALSGNLERGTNLAILGFPLGLGANSPTSIEPVFGSAVVGLDGLQNDGTILTTASNFDHGNSGGPVMVETESGELIVVGIVSAYAGKTAGIIVPISVIK